LAEPSGVAGATSSVELTITPAPSRAKATAVAPDPSGGASHDRSLATQTA
jgi:hypothetical protein